jgi:transcriptional regulator with XRE-family HTH domain
VKNNLRRIREHGKKWKTAKEFAAAMGVSKTYISNVETGLERKVSEKFWEKAAGLLGCSVDDLVRVEDPGETPMEGMRFEFSLPPTAEAEIKAAMQAEACNTPNELAAFAMRQLLRSLRQSGALPPAAPHSTAKSPGAGSRRE